MVEKLVEASQYLDQIFWRQSDPEGLALYKSSQDPKLRRLLMIHGSRFDLIDENRPFAGTEPMSEGHGLYPKGLTRVQIEQYVKLHPEKKDELYSPFTVIERRGNEFLAKWISAVAIFPCEGARDAASERTLAAAFEKGGWERVTRLYRRGDLPDEQCWLNAPDWALAYG